MQSSTRNRGFTLPELMVGLLIATVLVVIAHGFLSSVVPRESLISTANNMIGLIYRGRERAIGDAPVLLCADGSGCNRFGNARAIVLVRDSNNNRQLDHGETILRRKVLPQGMTVSWHSFRNKPWLRFNSRARSYYQNGHFQFCYRNFSLNVVMTRIGRPRVDRHGVINKKCPTS